VLLFDFSSFVFLYRPFFSRLGFYLPNQNGYLRKISRFLNLLLPFFFLSSFDFLLMCVCSRFILGVAVHESVLIRVINKKMLLLKF
jgi:hypothetical protein